MSMSMSLSVIQQKRVPPKKQGKMFHIELGQNVKIDAQFKFIILQDGPFKNVALMMTSSK